MLHIQVRLLSQKCLNITLFLLITLNNLKALSSWYCLIYCICEKKDFWHDSWEVLLDKLIVAQNHGINYLNPRDLVVKTGSSYFDNYPKRLITQFQNIYKQNQKIKIKDLIQFLKIVSEYKSKLTINEMSEFYNSVY